MNLYDTNYLEHYGVLGMRWGHRKAESRANREIRKLRRQAKKNIRLMSDDELNQYISRLSREQTLRSLLSKDTSTAMTKTRDFLAKNGENIASQFIKQNAVPTLNRTIGVKGAVTQKVYGAAKKQVVEKVVPKVAPVINRFRRKRKE